MTSNLPKGITVTTKSPTKFGLFTANLRFPAFGTRGRESIFLQCASDLETGVLCKNEIFLIAEPLNSDLLRELTDDQVKEIFKDHGWSISPTRCPECITKGYIGKRERV